MFGNGDFEHSEICNGIVDYTDTIDYNGIDFLRDIVYENGSGYSYVFLDDTGLTEEYNGKWTIL